MKMVIKRIIELSSLSYLDNDQSIEPHLDIQELFHKNEGVALFSGTINGLFGQLFDRGKFSDILTYIQNLNQSMKIDFILKFKDMEIKMKKAFEKFNLSLSSKEEIPIIATHEVFYLNKDMYEAHDALICIKNKDIY